MIKAKQIHNDWVESIDPHAITWSKRFRVEN